uniref:Uncharacterized protein n=1 Tax=Anopheles darlingi TaxID=43151 RepID=A0A2M4D361_ANODA
MVAPPSYVPLCICVATVEAALPSITNARPPPSLLCSCFFYVEPTQTHTHTYITLSTPIFRFKPDVLLHVLLPSPHPSLPLLFSACLALLVSTRMLPLIGFVLSICYFYYNHYYYFL